jgi:hypothetical protein
MAPSPPGDDTVEPSFLPSFPIIGGVRSNHSEVHETVHSLTSNLFQLREYNQDPWNHLIK